MKKDVTFMEEPLPVVCFPRKLAENITKIDSIDLYFWIYCYYSEQINVPEFKESFIQDEIQFAQTLKNLEWHNLMEFNEKSKKWNVKNGSNFRF